MTTSMCSRCSKLAIWLLLLTVPCVRGQEPPKVGTENILIADAAARADVESDIEFIDTGFENASPLWYETVAKGLIEVHLIYDPERSQPNRATGHFHLQLHAKVGTRLTIEFRNLDNVYNGRPGSVANDTLFTEGNKKPCATLAHSVTDCLNGTESMPPFTS